MPTAAITNIEAGTRNPAQSFDSIMAAVSLVWPRRATLTGNPEPPARSGNPVARDAPDPPLHKHAKLPWVPASNYRRNSSGS